LAELEEVAGDLGIIFGAVLTSNGLAAYVPDIEPLWIVVLGLVVTKASMMFAKKKRQRVPP
jgi:hypothetical protein